MFAWISAAFFSTASCRKLPAKAGCKEPLKVTTNAATRPASRASGRATANGLAWRSTAGRDEKAIGPPAKAIAKRAQQFGRDCR